MNDIYSDGRYLENNPHWHSGDSPWKAEQIHNLLVARNLQPATIFEVGCGAGVILGELAKKLPASQFVGYDTSPQAIELCKKVSNDRVKFVRGDLLSARENPPDLTICADVFEHIPDHLGFLKTLCRTQKLVIFHIPLDRSLVSFLIPSILTRTREMVGHLHFFNESIAKSTLEACGFRVLEDRITAGCLEFPEPGLKGRVFWLVRKVVFLISPHLAARLLGGFSLLVLAEPGIAK